METQHFATDYVWSFITEGLDLIPLPASGELPEQLWQLVQASEPGEVIELDRAAYDHCLESHPAPIHLEGDFFVKWTVNEPPTLFWREGFLYYAKRLSASESECVAKRYGIRWKHAK